MAVIGFATEPTFRRFPQRARCCDLNSLHAKGLHAMDYLSGASGNPELQNASRGIGSLCQHRMCLYLEQMHFWNV
jgi:hypothetical protein